MEEAIIAIIGLAILIAILIGIIIFLRVILRDRSDYRKTGTTYYHPSTDRAGLYGEALVNFHLKQLLKGDEHLLTNLLLPLKNGGSVELDAVIVSHKGVFCIETKYWVGHIIGSDDEDIWYQEYDDPSREDREHLNPVKQNEGHCGVLDRILHRHYPISNVVIFAELEDDSNLDSKYCFSLSEFEEHYDALLDNVLTQDEINAIYQILYKYIASDEELAKHRKQIQERYNHFN